MLEVYTDGSSIGNPGLGGYAYLIIKDKKVTYFAGSCDHATNNEMELKAIISALESIPKNNIITVYSDSEYCVKGATSWVKRWSVSKWKTREGIQVANKHLWKTLLNLINHRKVTFKHIKGHSYNIFNNIVDNLAKEAARRQISVTFERDLPELFPKKEAETNQLP